MRARLARILLACLAVLVLVAVFAVVGCKSDTRRIAEGASEVTLLAGDTKDKLAQIIELLRPYAQQIGALVFALLDAARDNQDGIIGRAAEVQSAAAGVTDKVWAGWAVLKLWGWVFLIITIVGAAIYFAVGPIIRKVTAWLGWFIPRADQEAAEMDLAAMRAHPESAPVRESIAAKKARKPTYDAAFRKAKRKEREKAISGKGG